MRLGLQKGIVKLVPYNPNWKEIFNEEKKRLKIRLSGGILGPNINIEHIGSTAIPGIKAKPIIDLLIGVQGDQDIIWAKEPLENLGYRLLITPYDKPDESIFLLEEEDIITHCAHVVEYQKNRWNELLLFRNCLLTNPYIAKRYNTLKEELAKKYAKDRKSYTECKEEFISKVLKK